MVSVELHGGADTAGRVCERTRVFTLAVSLGSVESLIEHPARMTHCTTAGTPVGVSDSLLRLSIGLEDCDELIADLDQALADLTGAHGPPPVKQRSPRGIRVSARAAHMGTLMPRLTSQTFAGQELKYPMIMPICMRSQ